MENLFYPQGYGLLEEKLFSQIDQFLKNPSKKAERNIDWQLIKRLPKDTQSKFILSISEKGFQYFCTSSSLVYNITDLNCNKDSLYILSINLLNKPNKSSKIYSNIIYFCLRSKFISQNSTKLLDEFYRVTKDYLKSNFSNMKFLREIGSLFSNILTIEDWLSFLKSESQLKGKKLLFACLSDVPYSVEDNINIRMGKISFLPGALDNVNLNGRNKREYRKFLQVRSKYNPTKIIERGILQNRDISNENVNVKKGIRVSPDLNKYEHKLYLFGGSEVFGTGLKDNETIANNLGKKLFDKKIEVVNMGMGGSNWIDLLVSVLNQKCNDSDQIILMIPVLGFQWADIKIKFSENDLNKSFIDKHHLSPYGASLSAEQIRACLKKKRKSNFYNKTEEKIFKTFEIVDFYKEFLLSIEANDSQKNALCDYKNYLNSIKVDFKNENLLKFGSVAVNCNPITKGHLHLIKYAAKAVDFLYVLVIEEDKSKFSFKDRLYLVKKACSELHNVKVIKGGKFVCTEYILPEYFYKDKYNSEDIDISMEAYFFGEHIAPCLEIKKIFLGDEPICKVTNSYNKQMSKMMESYDINVEIIDRISTTDGDLISASTVRKLLDQKKFTELKKFLPSNIIDDVIKIYFQ